MVNPDGERTACNDMEEGTPCFGKPASAVGSGRFASTGFFCSCTPPLVCTVGNGSADVFEGTAGAVAIPADGAFDALEDRGVDVTVGVGVGNVLTSFATAFDACPFPLVSFLDSEFSRESSPFFMFPDRSVRGAAIPAAMFSSALPQNAIDGINNTTAMMIQFLFIRATSM